MSRKKRNFSVDFKTKVVLELLQGDESLNQVSSKYDVLPRSLQQWKEHFIANASIAMDSSKVVKEYKADIQSKEEEIEALQKELGKTVLEREFLEKKLDSLDLSNKKSLVESKLKTIPLKRQCELLKVNRSSYYYKEKSQSLPDLSILDKIDKIYEETPFYGYRRICFQLEKAGFKISKYKTREYMKLLGIEAIYPKKRKNTSQKNYFHKTYPYLLKDLKISKPNQVWSGDISYIRMRGGFMYLAVIIDWYSKAVISWKLSKTMDVDLISSIMKDAISLYGAPKIFNSDQGSQYTSTDYTNLLKDNKIMISMNGKGRSIDNIASERFFRTIKYEDIYLKDYRTIKELKMGVKSYMDFYNKKRIHSAIKYKTPEEIFHKTKKVS